MGGALFGINPEPHKPFFSDQGSLEEGTSKYLPQRKSGADTRGMG
jgi:hypothetical protein